MPITVDGYTRLDSTLEAAADELAHMADAHREVAAMIARAARPPKRTGRLAASIRPVPDAAAAQVEATAPYAAAVEGGVPSRGIRPQPFLRQAVSSTMNRWEDVYARAVQAALDDVKGA